MNCKRIRTNKADNKIQITDVTYSSSSDSGERLNKIIKMLLLDRKELIKKETKIYNQNILVLDYMIKTD